jgi:AraC-like DNA-binding protein
MNIFRKAFGTTMVDFLLQHRLSHAQHLLLTTDASVIEVAGSAGFQSLSRFNEAFKRASGCAPRDYRKAHRHSEPLPDSRREAELPSRVSMRDTGSAAPAIMQSR